MTNGKEAPAVDLGVRGNVESCRYCHLGLILLTVLLLMDKRVLVLL